MDPIDRANLSTLTTVASGKVGDLIFADNPAGQYSRPAGSVIQPNTSFQITARGRFLTLLTRWTATLTASQRAAWNAFAATWPHVNRLGTKVLLSGQSTFLAMNMRRVTTGDPPGDTPPAIAYKPTFSRPTITLTVSGPSQFTNVFFNINDNWWSTAGARLVVQSGPTQKPSINFYNGPWRTRLVIKATTPSPQRFADSIPIFTNPRKAIRTYVTYPDGRYSAYYRSYTWLHP
jgi:hypothetical protein